MTEPSLDGDLAAMLTAYAAGDHAAALEAARRAARTGDPVACAATAYLEGAAERDARSTYERAEAFAAFIRGGGNQRLYRATSAALRAVYRELPRPFRVADIGIGDGLAVLPALEGFDAELTAIEPAPALLSTAVRGLEALGARHEAFPMTIEAFIRAHGDRRFDLIEATFSLHGLPPEDRREVLAWARRAGGRLVIAEFDVPRFAADLDPARIAYVLDRYRRGLGEYAGDGGLVAQGFLMPIMLGYFRTGRARTTHEQPLADWIADARAAGFRTIAPSVIDDYWWAPAFVLDCR